MTSNKRNLNAACQGLGDAVAKLSYDDRSSIRAVRRAFATLETAISRINRDLDRLANAVGPVKGPLDQVRQ
jgi:hypothetical protein